MSGQGGGSAAEKNMRANVGVAAAIGSLQRHFL